MYIHLCFHHVKLTNCFLFLFALAKLLVSQENDVYYDQLSFLCFIHLSFKYLLKDYHMLPYFKKLKCS